MLLSRFVGNILLKIFAFVIACGNVIVNVFQRHSLPAQTQTKTSNVGVTVILNMRKCF
jgi:hypothetical protein